jgi:hypothetical protein
MSFECYWDNKRMQVVKQASPVAWCNINLKGTYNFELSKKLPDLEELMCSIEGYVPVQEK